MRRLLLALTLASLAALLAPANAPAAPAARPPAAPQGLTLTTVHEGGRALLSVTSAGRFELRLDEGGIVAWYDLGRDPGRGANLVAPGQTLVTHRGAGGAPLRGAWRVERETPVLAQISWSGAGFTRSYTIWAAGQVAISTLGSAEPMALARNPAGATGAALQSDGAGAAMLFLDAWTGEDRPATLAAAGAGEPALAAIATGGVATLTVPPEAGLRAPRLVIEGWSGPARSVRQGGALLIEGQDYLAHWEQATDTLYVQVLAGLPPGGDPAGRTFSVTQQATPGLSLGVRGRVLNADGLLQVDGNMPDNGGKLSLYDLFFIPYIQTAATANLTAVFQGAGAGVEFLLNGESRKVFGAAGSTLEASFTLPAFGEYRLDGYIIDEAGNRLSPTPDDTIAPFGFGRVIITIGDSITGGSNGDEVAAGDVNFPVTSYLRSPAASQDRRNIFQFDNRNFYGAVQASFQRGYQLSLNDLLTACGGDPVFILNSGYGGLRLTYKRSETSEPSNNTAMAKLPTYLDQIDKLDADYLIIQLGTNDAFDGQSRTFFRRDLDTFVDTLRGSATGRHIWLARLPYNQFRTITDPATLADRQKRLVDFNKDITSVANALNSAGRPVRLGPDFYTYFELNQTLLDDGTHPTQAGYEAMAQLWAGQALGLTPLAGLPCEAFATQGQAPPPPVFYEPRVWLPAVIRR